ncbi:helix-turn-helix transcriptional regulator [Tumebacillus lipolyticus]|uniref:Helix-turn-helix transcriptional regulator n=1 Tax=Tumebacillus lipolyticus TaxID=1280370 RepID=A0ABW5A464_9BACL
MTKERKTRLQQIRKQLQVRPKDLAPAVGVSRQALHNIERGLSTPRPHVEKALAKCLRAERDAQISLLKERLAVLQAMQFDETLFEEIEL